tara:strand:- start:1741 stop:2295 length:555 start_codon:yes stop_codon:yes gene_type:complete
MKKLILLVILTLFVGNIFAQEDDIIIPEIGFGLKAGLNSMHNRTVNASSDNVQKKTGVYIGAFVKIPTSDVFSVQTEIIYSSTEFQGRNNVNLLHIPVLLNFELGNGFTGFFGPEGQVLIDLGEAENSNLYNSFMFGFTFGARYQITPNFYIEGRPYFALSKFLEDDSGYRKFNTLQIGLAFKF